MSEPFTAVRQVKVLTCQHCGSSELQTMLKIETGVRFCRCFDCGKDSHFVEPHLSEPTA